MRPPSLPLSALGPIMLASLMMILIFVHRPPERPRIAPPDAVTGSFPFDVPELPDVALDLPDMPEMAIELPEQATPMPDGLQVFSDAGLYNAEERAALAADLAAAQTYAVNRFGSGPTGGIHVAVHQDDACALHGAALTGQRRAHVVTCSSIPRQRVVNIMAHEFVHQLAHDYYGPDHLRADMILLEGLATWGAGDYWLAGQPSFRAYMRHHLMDDRLPLNTSYVGRPIYEMNMLYYQWGSFVEFLLETYGRERFDAVYVSGNKQPGSADYVGVYGKDLATLEQEWLRWLDA